MSKIEKELIEVTGVKPGKDRAKFLAAVHKKVMELPDEGWDKLSDGAQKWANGYTKAGEGGKDLPDFPDAKAAEAEEKVEKTEKAKPAAKDTKAEKPAKEEKAKPEAKAAPKAEKAAPKKKAPGRIEQMKTIMLKNLKDKADDLKAKLVAAGIEVSDATITTVRSDFMSTLRVLKKSGKLDETFAGKLDD